MVSNARALEKELTSEKEKFRALFNLMPDPAVIVDGKGKFLEISDKATEVSGYRKEELLGKNFFRKNIVTAGSKVVLIENLVKRMMRLHVAPYEIEVVTKDGRKIPFEVNAAKIEYAGKHADLVVFRDISERKDMEQKLEEHTEQLEEKVKERTTNLRESEQKSRILLENLPQKIFFKDKNLVYVSCNENYAQDLKIKAEEIAGKTDYDFFPKMLAEKYRADDERIMESGNTEDIEEEYVQDGQKRFVHTVKTPVKDESGNVVGILGIFRDITQRKQAEQAIQESEERYRELTESISDVFFAMDKDLRYTFWNKASEKLTGISAKDAIGKSLTDVFSDVEGTRIEQFYLEALRTRQPKTFVNEYQVGGKNYVFEINAYPTKDGLSVFVKDITEQRKAEQTIRESQQKFERLFRNIPDAAVYWDSDFCVLDGNPRFSELFGYSLDEIKGKPTRNLVPNDRLEETEILMKKSREGYVGYESVRKRKDGSLVPVSISVAPIIIEGELTGFVGLYKDITERKQAEQALLNEKEFSDNLINSMQDGFSVLDAQGVHIIVNPAFCEITGFSREELIGVGPPHPYWSPEICGDIERSLQKDLHGERRVANVEYIFMRKNGERFPVILSPSVIKDKQGNVISVFATVKDITERKQMEEKLRQYSEHLEELVQRKTDELLESEKRYSVVVEKASDGVVIHQDGRIVFANKKASDIIGYPKEEQIGLPPEKLVNEKYLPEVMETRERRMRGEIITHELEVKAKTGESIPVETSESLITYQGHPAVLIIIRDIRERKRMEEQRLRLEKLAAIGELATMVGHDLRNPLQGIANATYYLKRKLKSGIDDKTKEILELIEDDIKYSDKIVNDLLDYSREPWLELTETTPKSIIKEALSLVEVPSNIQVAFSSQTNLEIKVDVEKMKRVFVNIIQNAIDAMPEGGKLTIRNQESGGNIEFIFSDTGTGMSKETLEKLWTPLFTTKAKGMGFGLAICKRLVEAHKGKISVESTIEKGSTFTVTILIDPELEGGEKLWVNPQESLLSTTTRA